MKQLKFFIGGLMVAAVSMFGLTACGDDDPELPGEFPTPTYEKDAAKFDLESNSLGIESIELTASGNYLVTPEFETSLQDQRAAKKGGIVRNNMFAGAPMSRAYGQFITGKYTKESDNVYNLQGFGKLTVVADGDKAYKLTITQADGTTVDAVAEKAVIYPSSEMTDALCRTWDLTSFGFAYNVDGKTFFDGTRPVGEISDLVRDFYKALLPYLEDEEDFDDNDLQDMIDELKDMMPKQAVFTKSGTYLVIYADSRLAISTWKWANENKGILHYSWNYGDENDSDMSGDVNVKFNKGGMVIDEAFDDSDEDTSTVTTYHWGFTPAK